MNPVLARIAPSVDAAFYLARNPDVARAGMAAAEHYWRAGWREGRDPSAWFATEYYLRANPDVAGAGLNPLWHYLERGRREGRPPRPPGGPWREELDRPHPAAPPAALPADPLGPAVLRQRLAAASAGARGLVLALSHDRYTEIPGGTQLLIAGEQRKVNGDGGTYLHLCPAVAGHGLAPAADAPAALGVTLDGAWLGVATADRLAAALRALPAALRRLLVVHALHGWQPETVAALAAALRPHERVFWAHDYGAGCASPRLLRNDIAPCHGPPPDSLGCRICRHGDGRVEHLARVRALFAAVPFCLAAPSATAAAAWTRSTGLKVAAVHVHPHAVLAPQPPRPAAGGPVRIGFIGAAAYHKGWPWFRDLVGAARALPEYRFFHFADAAALRPMDGLAGVAVSVTPAAPFVMQQALAARRIDLVLALSPWPETFSYAAHEALAAGADLLTVAGSGHIAALVRATGRGAVLADADALAAFVLSRRAVPLVRARREAGRPGAHLHHVGSTATLALSDAAAITDDPDLHLLIGRRRIDAARNRDVFRFALPPAAARRRVVRLRSRSLDTAWDPALCGDGRHLGVAVRALALDGVPVPSVRLGAGWHAAEDELRWTDGDAAIDVAAARCLDVRIAPMLRYWRVPLFVA